MRHFLFQFRLIRPRLRCIITNPNSPQSGDQPSAGNHLHVHDSAVSSEPRYQEKSTDRPGLHKLLIDLPLTRLLMPLLKEPVGAAIGASSGHRVTTCYLLQTQVRLAGHTKTTECASPVHLTGPCKTDIRHRPRCSFTKQHPAGAHPENPCHHGHTGDAAG